jgi:alkanesulfonate monooxygenase SsuD/methylene tetrahydromethanopterin reductase-like flavin-dependent oxidoreductase (luciferase family)
MGIPLYPPGQRIRRLDEACTIIKQLFTQHLTTFDGRYYQLKEARCEPKPLQKPHPPFVIGGSGEKLTLRVVAKHADVWNFVRGSAEEFKRKVDILHNHCQTVGRDPNEITLSTQVRVNYQQLEETTEAAQQLVATGATHLVFTLGAPYPEGIVQRLAEEVIPDIQ